MSIKSKLILAAAAGLVLMCGCKNNSAELPEAAASAAEVTMAKMTEPAGTTEQTETTASKAAEETTAVQTEAEQVDFEYQPPREVLNTHFYSDDIEAEIKWESILTEDLKEQVDWDYISTADMPEFIIEDILKYSLENSEYVRKYADDHGEPSHGFGYMMYDMNDDGADDYIVKCGVGYIWIPDGEEFYKIYLTNEDGSYTPITWDCVEEFHPTQYILKTKTNGLKDIMVLHNSNHPIITYDGGDTYTPCEMLDERHTFTDSENLPNNTMHFNMQVSVIDAPLGEYYIAIKVADKPYIKNNVLYTCYPDGTPRTYTQKPFGEALPTDFHPSQEGYDFYVELTDEGTKHNKISLNILEIKYIAADE